MLGVAVLGTAVLQPEARIEPSPDLRPSLRKQHHTACSCKPDSRWPNQMGYLGAAVLGVAVLGTAVLQPGTRWV